MICCERHTNWWAGITTKLRRTCIKYASLSFITLLVFYRHKWSLAVQTRILHTVDMMGVSIYSACKKAVYRTDILCNHSESCSLTRWVHCEFAIRWPRTPTRLQPCACATFHIFIETIFEFHNFASITCPIGKGCPISSCVITPTSILCRDRLCMTRQARPLVVPFHAYFRHHVCCIRFAHTTRLT